MDVCQESSHASGFLQMCFPSGLSSFLLEVSWLWEQWVCRFFSAKVLVKIALECLGSISLPDCEPPFTVCLYACENSTLNKIFPKYWFCLIRLDWVGHFGKFETTLWDLVIFSPGNWKWDLMQIVALKIFAQPHKIGVRFTTGKVFHCLQIGLSFARENYIAHLLPKFIISTTVCSF